MDKAIGTHPWYLDWMQGDQSWRSRQSLLQLEQNWKDYPRSPLEFFRHSIQFMQYELFCQLFQSKERSARPSPHTPSYYSDSFATEVPLSLHPALTSQRAYENVIFLSGTILNAVTSEFSFEREYQYRCILASLVTLRACDVSNLQHDAQKTLSNNIMSRHSDLHKSNVPKNETSTSSTISNSFQSAQVDTLIFAISEMAKRMPTSQKVSYTLFERGTNLLSVILTITSAATGSSAVNVEFTVNHLQEAFKPISPKPEASADPVFTVFHATLITNNMFLLGTVLGGSEEDEKQATTYFEGAEGLASLVLQSIIDQLNEFGEFWSSGADNYQPHSRPRANSTSLINRSSSFKDFYKIWLLLDCAVYLKSCFRGNKDKTRIFDALAMRIAPEANVQSLRLKALEYILNGIKAEDREPQIDNLLLRARHISRARESALRDEIEVINNEYLPGEDQFEAEPLLDKIRRPSTNNETIRLVADDWTEESFPIPDRKLVVKKAISSQVHKHHFTNCDIAVSDELDERGLHKAYAIFSSDKLVHVYHLDHEEIKSDKPVFVFSAAEAGQSKKDFMIERISVSSSCLSMIGTSTVFAVDFSRGWSSRVITHHLEKGFLVTALAVQSDPSGSFIALGYVPNESRGLVVEIYKVDVKGKELVQLSNISIPTKNPKQAIVQLEFAKDGQRLVVTTDDNYVLIFLLQNMRAQHHPFVIFMKYGQSQIPYAERRGITSSTLFESPSGLPYILLGTAPTDNREDNLASMCEFPFISPVSDYHAECPASLQHPVQLPLGDVLSVAVCRRGHIAALADNLGHVAIAELSPGKRGGLRHGAEDKNSHVQIEFSSGKWYKSMGKPKSTCVKWVEGGDTLELLALDNQGRTIRASYANVKGSERRRAVSSASESWQID